ncbi:YraN family protein [Proteinivorax tanatarense]|uniref:UPF0102 protein PRVXT_001373 n=1 Tax=Proteinivorax tanatarense TaxID=1260629 RepID=A0AAU7VQ36_9FIRM
MNNQQLARYGEKLAVEFLMSNGLKIIEVNYRCKLGEIDIIAREKGVIVFCEVKTRKNKNIVHPFSSITTKKLYTISKVAHFFILTNHLENRDYRIDAIAVYFEKENPRIKWIKNCTY